MRNSNVIWGQRGLVKWFISNIKQLHAPIVFNWTTPQTPTFPSTRCQRVLPLMNTNNYFTRLHFRESWSWMIVTDVYHWKSIRYIRSSIIYSLLSYIGVINICVSGESFQSIPLKTKRRTKRLRSSFSTYFYAENNCASDFSIIEIIFWILLLTCNNL